MANKELKTQQAKAFVMIAPGNWPIVPSARSRRREVTAWADEHMRTGGWETLRKRGYRIEKMLLVPLGEQSE
ncbi:hypothetical protein [Brucella pseudogrignonensis]|uniref:Uncharacterized protein n=1 Tax=Brucella pseudogrignonensis TaxID=419475 RepID=A0ABU1M4U3_9HYPH|nr:hypothetical protein [Brucella pseudogrignonensis]MDR6431068.1 hypothetical protein [Brucella pseudogrignonensis]